MNKIKTKVSEPKMEKVQAGDDSQFFRRQYPDWMLAKTDKQWVMYMNNKYGFKWTGKDSK